MNKMSTINGGTLGKTHVMARIAVLSVFSYVLMLLELPLFFFPEFLKIDLSDLPALIGALSLGPMAGILIELIKNLLNLITKSSTGGIGELANFLIGISLIVPASMVYKNNRSRKGALMGMALGTLAMAIVGGLANYYVLIPFYSNFMPIEAIIDMSKATNKYIVDLKSLILYGVVPFNLIKGTVVSAVTLVIYKKISPILKIR
ncbi:MAG: ECF transporter S component [Anaeromicrobium sp.]|jgi:riboflavin transporter FmnP|uniref:ECF transporter S component n=1 Tax=Anaeromicrobium sp. TaxID=1929132 RepID=UPI0026004060|nr:ECF transporter S component [Anaeromicrobium sp.]MCT4592722.1 ECF transporter S component [Anaeromicrobium sp.]